MKLKPGLVIVLILALFLRLYRLNDLPVAMFGDEVDASYQAWSLATTLRDYRGHLLPTYAQSLSEWRAPLEMYLVAPFVGLLGPTNFSARLPMALMGITSILLIYLIVNILFPGQKLHFGRWHLTAGLVAALVLALTPWHLHYTRNVVEQPPLFLLTLLGVYLYLRAKSQPLFYPLALFVFILTFYTYSVANLATPIIILLLIFCYPPQIKTLFKKPVLIGLVLCVLAMMPIAYQILFGPAAGRFKLINIAEDQPTLDQIVLDRNRPWLTLPLVEKLVNNKITAISGEFINNYLTALSPQFLFLSGDPIYRQSVDHFGVFLVILAPFFLLGFIFLAKDFKNRGNLLPLLWLFFIPLGSSLTVGGGNHASRLFLMLFPVVTIIALGFMRFVIAIKSKYQVVTALLVTVGILLNFSAYWYRYTTHYAYESSHVWQYGYEPLFTKARPYIKEASRVFINNTAEPSLYRFAFYYPIKPADFQKMFSTDIQQPNLFPGFSGFPFGDKYYFGQAENFDSLNKLLKPGDIYLASQRMEVPGDWDLEKSPPAGLKVLVTVRDYYDRPLFYVLSK